MQFMKSIVVLLLIYTEVNPASILHRGGKENRKYS